MTNKSFPKFVFPRPIGELCSPVVSPRSSVRTVSARSLPAAPSRVCVIRDRIARVFRMCMSCRRIIRVHHAGVSRVHVARVAGARIMRARPRSQEKFFLRESSARIISVYREI